MRDYPLYLKISFVYPGNNFSQVVTLRTKLIRLKSTLKQPYLDSPNRNQRVELPPVFRTRTLAWSQLRSKARSRSRIREPEWWRQSDRAVPASCRD